MDKRKKTRKSPSKKIVRHRKKKTASTPVSPGIIDIDQFYRLVNQVQLERDDVKFKVLEIESSIIEHYLKDLELPYTKREKNKVVEYVVSPGKERAVDDDEEIEEFPDEISEDGQIFF